MLNYKLNYKLNVNEFMKKQVLFVTIAIMSLLCLSSCAKGFYSHCTSNMNMNQTQVVLSQNNFRVVKTVHASVDFDNEPGFDEDLLEQSAYSALLKEAKLEGAQVLINVTVESVTRKSVFSNYYTVHVTGVVIEFTK